MTAAADLLPADVVSARLITGEQILTTQFPVTSVLGTVVFGSAFYPAGLDEATGWAFDLVTRPVVLPAVLTEITATLIDGSSRPVMGKGRVWSDASTGDPVDPATITAYTAS